MLFKLSVLAAAASLFSLAVASPVIEVDHAPAMVERAAVADDGAVHTTELMKRAPGPCELPTNDMYTLLQGYARRHFADGIRMCGVTRVAGAVVKPAGDDWIYTEVGWPGAGAWLALLRCSRSLIPDSNF